MGGRGVDGNEHALGNWVLNNCTQCEEKNVFCLVWFVSFYLSLLYWHCNTYICITAYSSPLQLNPTQK